LSRWKLLDNLRRSLVAPGAFLLLAFAWCFLPGSPWVWTAFVFVIIAFPVYANLANVFMISPMGVSLGNYVKGVGQDLIRHFQQSLLTFAFLPHQAFLMVHAIVITLHRVYVSRKNLLEWESAYS